MNTTQTTTTLFTSSAQSALARCKVAALAALLASGSLYVSAAPADKSVASATAVQVENSKVNINSASAEVLSSLHGIGASKAKSIVSYRNKFGNFRSIEDLLAVEGIGEATLTKNRGRISL